VSRRRRSRKYSSTLKDDKDDDSSGNESAHHKHRRRSKSVDCRKRAHSSLHKHINLETANEDVPLSSHTRNDAKSANKENGRPLKRSRSQPGSRNQSPEGERQLESKTSIAELVKLRPRSRAKSQPPETKEDEVKKVKIRKQKNTADNMEVSAKRARRKSISEAMECNEATNNDKTNGLTTNEPPVLQANLDSNTFRTEVNIM
jgi:hypothetical protein